MNDSYEHALARPLTEDERRLLEAGRAASAATLQRDREDRRRVADFMRVRYRAAKELKDSLVKRTLEAAGIESSEFRDRQNADRESILRFEAAELERAAERSRTVSEEQEKRIVARLESWQRNPRLLPVPPGSVPPPTPLFALVTTAALIETSSGYGAPAPQSNLAHPAIDADLGDDHLDGKLQIAYAEWFFLWQPPRDGSLTILGALVMNGHGFLWAEPGCLASSSASVATIVKVYGSQVDSTGSSTGEFDFFLPLAEHGVSKSWDESVGEIDSFTIDSDTPVTLPAPFPVVGGIPVAIRIGVRFDTYAHNAQARVDFRSGSFGLNVPFVYFFLG